MKAITLSDNTTQNPTPWASYVEAGLKTIETRTWPVPKDYQIPFDLLICASHSSRTPNKGLAICVVTVTACHPMSKHHEEKAMCAVYPGAWAWQTENLRWFNNKFSVSGRQRLFDYNLPERTKLFTPTLTDLHAMRLSLIGHI